MLGWKLWSEPGMLGKGWPAGGHRLLPRCSLQRPKKGAQGCLGVPETLPLDTKTLATIMLVSPPPPLVRRQWLLQEWDVPMT